MKKIHLLTIAILSLLVFTSQLMAQRQDNPTPTQSQLNWQKAELGVVFHYDLHVFDGVRYNQSYNRINPIEDYNIFNPTHLDTEQWIIAAKSAGAKFAILTATHETGFGLWQSDVNPYCLKALKWGNGKRDIVREFCDNCRKHGIAPGIYIGIRWNSFLGIHNFKAEGDGEFAKKRQAWYKHYCEKMVEEICSRYGELFMIWFDGGADDPKGLGPNVEPIVNKYQPHCLFYHNSDRADLRWGGSESGTVAYPCYASFPYASSHNKYTDGNPKHIQLLKNGDPEGTHWMPAMADAPFRCENNRHEWFWEPNDENNIATLNTLMNMYEKSVGRNATLMIGLTPNPDGLLDEGDVVRLNEWGKEIANRYSTPLAQQTKTTKNCITLKWNTVKSIDRVVIQENIAKGEHVRAYTLEVYTEGKWKVAGKGENIGQKRIHSFTPISAKAIRLTINKTIAPIEIENFSVYEKL